MRSHYTILALSALLGACADSTTSPSRVLPLAEVLAAKGSATSAGGRIYYQADHDEPGNSDIYSMNPDGTGIVRLLTQVTFNNDLDQHPRFGPKGQWIVFMSERDGDREVYTMKSDGTAVSRITNSAGNDERPEWSPDGKRIGFISGRSGESAVYSANINGTGVSRISPVGQPAYQYSWGPSGKQVAFRGVAALWVVNADGTGATSLNNASLPSWGK